MTDDLTPDRILATLLNGAEFSIDQYMIIRNPLTTRPAKDEALDNLGWVLEGIAGAAELLKARQPADIVLQAAQQRMNGDISDDEFAEVMARATLGAQGVENPTAEQLAMRISELNTANSFISAMPDDVE